MTRGDGAGEGSRQGVSEGKQVGGDENIIQHARAMGGRVGEVGEVA